MSETKAIHQQAIVPFSELNNLLDSLFHQRRNMMDSISQTANDFLSLHVWNVSA